jgi:hypothetical protein
MHKKDRPIINKVARARYGNWTVCQVGERILEDGTRTYNDAIHQGRGDDLYDNSVKLADFKLPFQNGVLDIWVYTYELDRGEAYYELKENMYVTIVAGRVTEASWDYDYSQLAKYEGIASTMSNAALRYSIEDIKATWKANPIFADAQTEYGAKLWAEWDAYTVELYRRNRKNGAPPPNVDGKQGASQPQP